MSSLSVLVGVSMLFYLNGWWCLFRFVVRNARLFGAVYRVIKCSGL